MNRAAHRRPGEALCLACGLCCNGALFRDVELQSGDAAARLRALGMPVRSRRRADGSTLRRIAQPCAALGAGCRCRLYAERPMRCRQFDCALLQRLLKGDLKLESALRVVRGVRRRLAGVLRRLRALGERNEAIPLNLRFRRLQRRLEQEAPSVSDARLFADLTQRFHALHLKLRQEMHPGPQG